MFTLHLLFTRYNISTIYLSVIIFQRHYIFISQHCPEIIPKLSQWPFSPILKPTQHNTLIFCTSQENPVCFKSKSFNEQQQNNSSLFRDGKAKNPSFFHCYDCHRTISSTFTLISPCHNKMSCFIYYSSVVRAALYCTPVYNTMWKSNTPWPFYKKRQTKVHILFFIYT